MNYTVEIRVDSYSSSNSTGFDLIPHTFMVITGPDGIERGYGFAPEQTGLFGDGNVQDDTSHVYDASSGKLSITEDQYSQLMEYINRTSETPPPYALPFGSQCTNWVLAGLAEADIIPSLLGPQMEPNNILVDFLQTLIFNPLWQKIGFEINDLIDNIKNLFATAEAQSSPIILDLDGNGVSTVSRSAGIHFDHDGNGFAELTGWVGAGDGLLVWDRNGNGVIDDGSELFGNHTVLANGQKAANGFVALAGHDSNGDGVFDAYDVLWSELRVWRDLSQDGISQTDELFTLDELGIASISLGYTNSSHVDAQGNAHRQVGSFTWADGNTGTATDVWFAADFARTKEVDLLEVPADIAALPDLAGFGNVRSLHQAMVRDESGQLQAQMGDCDGMCDAQWKVAA